MEIVSIRLWYEALGNPLGVVVQTDDPERAKQRLYALRKQSGDVDLESISIVQSPSDPNHLWLVKRKQPDAS